MRIPQWKGPGYRSPAPWKADCGTEEPPIGSPGEGKCSRGAFDMTISSRGESYVLGGTGHEHERLIRQARIFNPFTERLFRNAGVARGQRVLDIGSGVGDVAMLVAELVGPTRGRRARC